jgi:hypothetical protein
MAQVAPKSDTPFDLSCRPDAQVFANLDPHQAFLHRTGRISSAPQPTE